MIDSLLEVRGVRYASLVDAQGQVVLHAGEGSADVEVVNTARAMLGSLKSAMSASTRVFMDDSSPRGRPTRTSIAPVRGGARHPPAVTNRPPAASLAWTGPARPLLGSAWRTRPWR